jgi:predicted SAM-dependent methyltransferase
MYLDLGCGNAKKEGWIGIDVSEDSQADIVMDLGSEEIPLPDNSVDGARAIHVIEHVPFWVHASIYDNAHWRPMVHFLQEVYRVLKPGAEFYILTLCYPDPRCFQDPDHKSVWTLDTIKHFVGGLGEVGDANSRRTGLYVPFELLCSQLTTDGLLEIRLRKPYV